MRSFTFCKEDLTAIAHNRYHHPHPRVQCKMEVLWLKSHDLPHAQIATLAGVSRATVQRYLDEYLEGGLERVRRFRWRKPETALAEHTFTLEEYFWDHPPHSARQAAAVIEQQTGVRRGLTQVRSFLACHLGLRWTKVGSIPCPPKKEPAEHARTQAAFLEEQLAPLLAEARRGQRAVFFVDAAHFVFAPFLGFVWCLARLFVRAASGRKRYNVLGALNAVTHEVLRVTNQGYINAESVCTLLRSIAAQGLRVPITLVLDNARYQRCALVQELAASLGIELLFLPSYSPNLNLIERLWRFLRKQVLDSVYYEKFDQFTAGIDQGLDELTTRYKGEMDTLLTHNFQLFQDVPILAA
jgi:transposase